MRKDIVFISFSTAFALGVAFASLFILSINFLLIGLGLVAVIFAVAWQNKFIFYAVVCAAAFIFGCLRIGFFIQPNFYEPDFNSKQVFEGYIVEDADMRQANQFLTFQPKNTSQKILIKARTDEHFVYGDLVVVKGKLLEPENFSEFDYIGYLKRFGIYATMNYPQILILKSNQLNWLKDFLLTLKTGFIFRVSAFLPEPRSSLLMGILIGARKSLPPEIVDNFNTTGTSHIIAVSGYNISIIIFSLGFLTRYLGRRRGFFITSFLIVCFVILTGASASVVRAGVMGFLVLLSLRLGRQYTAAPALFFAGLVMLILNPLILIWDLSFGLSFLATLGIIYFLPMFESFSGKWPEVFGFKALLLTTLAAVAATLPLILFAFGRLSLVAPLVNLLVLPVIPLTMLLGFFSVLPFLGPGFAFAADLFLRYILRITSVFASLPFASLSLKISPAIFLLIYVFEILIYVLGIRLLKTRRG